MIRRALRHRVISLSMVHLCDHTLSRSELPLAQQWPANFLNACGGLISESDRPVQRIAILGGAIEVSLNDLGYNFTPFVPERFLTGRSGRNSSVSSTPSRYPNFMGSLPEFVAVNPTTLECPRCKAEAGHACETTDRDSEPVHLERIAAALAMDQAAKKGRACISSKPSRADGKM
jgi:hypothetical protein